jgi:hypothetical protein
MPQKRLTKQKISDESKANAEIVMPEKTRKDEANQPLYITRI